MRHACIALAAACLLLGCGSQESKLDRGLVVGEEEAAPLSNQELGMTEDEREKQNVEEETVEERKAFQQADEDL